MGGREESKPQLYVEPRLPVWWNRAVLVVTVLTLVEMAVDFTLHEKSLESRILSWIDFSFCLVFLADFGWRIHLAPSRWAFLRRNWLDLVGAIPFVGPLRGARVIRFMRILRLTRFMVLVRRAVRRVDVPLPGHALGYLGVAAVVWWLFAGIVFKIFEVGVNENIKGYEDALWWSITTLSTVGYGDLYPVTLGGRVVAAATMALGVGILGTFGGTVATIFLDLRDKRKRGMRPVKLKEHLLVLGWNEKARPAVEEFRADPRFVDTEIVIVAKIQENPFDDPKVRFVHGNPGRTDVLNRAAAGQAGAAIVLAADTTDARSDYESALTIMSLRRLNPEVPVSAELISSDNREYMESAGCSAIIDPVKVASGLLVQGVQDIGVSNLVMALLSNDRGSEVYRVPVHEDFAGKSYEHLVIAMLRQTRTVVALERKGKLVMQPEATMTLRNGDVAFVISVDPP